jgi:hypothetical protein
MTLPTFRAARHARVVHPRHHRLQRLLVAAALMGCALAAAATEGELPAVQQSGEIRFVTGGVGDGEAAALRRERAQYGLTVEVYASEGGRQLFTADVQVTVRNPRGETLLQERTEGPYLLVDVPPGRYTVEVERMGQTQRQAVTVRGKGAARTVFVFKGG